MIGTSLGPYQVLAKLGEGGMGQVYRARDTKLNRDVALKVLPDSFASDAERLARFTREAQTLASLNHPNIAHIHGLEESGGVRALVMELVEGDDLSQRIARGAIPLDEALPIARQIAEALEAAHEAGVIHRDLKPANIKVRPDGTVKVLDFGLAKAFEQAFKPSSPQAPNDLATSPTITTPAHLRQGYGGQAMTQAGMILGTAAYMSPEQARGLPVDKRTDIWAFGCVLFEMLTGTRLFEGDTISDTLAAVLKSTPDWNRLPADTPAPIRRLLRRCIEKDCKRRLDSAAAARLEIEEALTPGGAAEALPGRAAAPRSRWRTLTVATLSLAASVALVALVVSSAWMGARWARIVPRVMRLAIVPPAGLPLVRQGIDRDIAIAPDGRRLVYRSTAGALVVRALDQLDARALTVTGARQPFFSPDGQWIGFFAEDGLRKVFVSGGPPILICRTIGSPRGASWGPDDSIIFATDDTASGLMIVPAAGGEPRTLTTPSAAQGETDHFFPSVLPGGGALLFTISGGARRNDQVGVFDLDTDARKTLLRGGSQAEYAGSGHLVYAAAGTLRAVRFDPARLEVLSDPVPVIEGVSLTVTGAANVAVSRDGTLVYVPDGADAARSLVWVTRQGQEARLNAPPRAYRYPRLSPDATRVALEIGDQDADIWIWDLARETLTRLTVDPQPDQYPVWMPDGRRLLFASERNGAPNLYGQAADGTGAVERVTTATTRQFPSSVTPDGKHVVLRDDLPTTGFDVVLLTLESRQVQPLVRTTFREFNGEVSPDGRWIAYQSDESGQDQIYVRPFPQADSGRWQVSTGGGMRPLWARNGRELFYLDAAGRLTAAPVQTTGSTFGAGSPVKLLDSVYYAPAAGEIGRTYDVSPDGQRFLMVKENTGAGDQAAAPSLVVVENWFEELKARP